MKTIGKFLCCLFAGYILTIIMSFITPKILLLRATLLFILMLATIQTFYFWVKPTSLLKFSFKSAIVLAPIAEVLSLVRHGIIVHDLTIYSIMFPFGFGILLPFISAGIYKGFYKK